MTIERWLASSTADARNRGLDALVPLLEGLAQALTALRNADFNRVASGERERGDAIPKTSPDPPSR